MNKNKNEHTTAYLWNGGFSAKSKLRASKKVMCKNETSVFKSRHFINMQNVSRNSFSHRWKYKF